MKILPLSLLLFLTTACGALETAQSVVDDPFGENGADLPAKPEDTPQAAPWQPPQGGTLYSFDGTPVGQGGPLVTGAQQPQSPARGLGGSGDSRPQILDMYAEAVAERDSLRRESAALLKDLERAEDFIIMVEDELDAGAAALAAAIQRAEEAERKNLDMADRLAASELARLKAEERWMLAAIEKATDTGNEGGKK